MSLVGRIEKQNKIWKNECDEISGLAALQEEEVLVVSNIFYHFFHKDHNKIDNFRENPRRKKFKNGWDLYRKDILISGSEIFVVNRKEKEGI